MVPLNVPAAQSCVSRRHQRTPLRHQRLFALLAGIWLLVTVLQCQPSAAYDSIAPWGDTSTWSEQYLKPPIVRSSELVNDEHAGVVGSAAQRNHGSAVCANAVATAASALDPQGACSFLAAPPPYNWTLHQMTNVGRLPVCNATKVEAGLPVGSCCSHHHNCASGWCDIPNRVCSQHCDVAPAPPLSCNECSGCICRRPTQTTMCSAVVDYCKTACNNYTGPVDLNSRQEALCMESATPVFEPLWPPSLAGPSGAMEVQCSDKTSCLRLGISALETMRSPECESHYWNNIYTLDITMPCTHQFDIQNAVTKAWLQSKMLCARSRGGRYCIDLLSQIDMNALNDCQVLADADCCLAILVEAWALMPLMATRLARLEAVAANCGVSTTKSIQCLPYPAEPVVNNTGQEGLVVADEGGIVEEKKDNAVFLMFELWHLILAGIGVVGLCGLGMFGYYRHWLSTHLKRQDYKLGREAAKLQRDYTKKEYDQYMQQVLYRVMEMKHSEKQESEEVVQKKEEKVQEKEKKSELKAAVMESKQKLSTQFTKFSTAVTDKAAEFDKLKQQRTGLRNVSSYPKVYQMRLPGLMEKPTYECLLRLKAHLDSVKVKNSRLLAMTATKDAWPRTLQYVKQSFFLAEAVGRDLGTFADEDRDLVEVVAIRGRDNMTWCAELCSAKIVEDKPLGAVIMLIMRGGGRKAPRPFLRPDEVEAQTMAAIQEKEQAAQAEYEAQVTYEREALDLETIQQALGDCSNFKIIDAKPSTKHQSDAYAANIGARPEYHQGSVDVGGGDALNDSHIGAGGAGGSGHSVHNSKNSVRLEPGLNPAAHFAMIGAHGQSGGGQGQELAREPPSLQSKTTPSKSRKGKAKKKGK